MVVVQQSAEARSTGDLAICPVVIRRTDVPDELATNALVKPLGHVVLDEFFDQVAEMPLAKNDELIETFVLHGLNESFGVNAFQESPEELAHELAALRSIRA